LAKATAPGEPVIHLVDFQVTANSSFEVFPDASRAELMIHGLSKNHESPAESQTDTEWAMDGLENHRNFVVQAGACLAAVPMGIWEQTAGAISRKSHEKLYEADGMVQRIVWKTPLQQNLADEIARTLAPRTTQPVMLRKLPSISNEGSPAGDVVRISSKGAAVAERAIELRPETALEVRVTKVELGSNQGSKRRPSLSLEANVTLLRTSDGQELFAWPVRYSSAPRGISEWAAHDGVQVEEELRRSSRQIAEAVVAQLLREGCVVPGRAPDSVIARN
jgi:hypothetical protein